MMQISKSSRKDRKLWYLSAAILICGTIYLAETSWFRDNHSVTYDETLYLTLSNRSVLEGKLSPLFVTVGVAPLPMILTYLPPLWMEPAPEREENWRGALFDPEYIKGPRFTNSLLIGVPIIVVVVLWLTKRHGVLAGFLGGGLTAMSPSMIAHGGMATTDLSFTLFAVVSLLLIGWMASKPNVKRASIAGAAIGVTVAAKYSGLFLLPASGLLLALHLIDFSSFRAVRISLYQIISKYLILLTVAFLVCWGCHLFTSINPLKTLPVAETEDSSMWVKTLGRGPVADSIMTFCYEKLNRPAPYDGILFQVHHSRDGHGAYLMGNVKSSGWWYYFPCVFAFKSTPAELLLAAGLALSVCFSLRSLWKKYAELETSKQSMILGVIILMGLLMTSSINIGQRYMILVYPILIMLGIDLLWNRLTENRCLKLTAMTILLAIQASSSFAIGPHYLGYFNSFAGGPQQGRWLLEDSNIDWGQDLPALSEFQSKNPEAMLLWYFGSALPQAYGVTATNLETFPESIDQFTYAALSTSYVIGPYGPNDEGDPFAQVREIDPVEIVGTSIVILDLREAATRKMFRTAYEKYKKIASQNSKHPDPQW